MNELNYVIKKTVTFPGMYHLLNVVLTPWFGVKKRARILPQMAGEDRILENCKYCGSK